MRNAPAPVYLSLAAAAALASAQWLVFVYAPVEAEMKLTQKIFYIHLPLAWWALVSFFVVFVASIAFLRGKKRHWDTLADAAAEIGVVLAGLALATGSIWAKAAWWTWWTWDPRLTTTLIMWFVYAAYLVLRGLDLPWERKAAVRAVVGIVAFLDVPLVFFATRLWNSVHPAGTMASRDGLEPEMRLAVIACLAAFGIFWLALLLLRYRLARLEERAQALRVGQQIWEELPPRPRGTGEAPPPQAPPAGA